MLFGWGITNLLIKNFAQGCLEDNPAESLQIPLGNSIPSKNPVLLRISRSTIGTIGLANGL